jgi:hypothetical protein
VEGEGEQRIEHKDCAEAFGEAVAKVEVTVKCTGRIVGRGPGLVETSGAVVGLAELVETAQHMGSRLEVNDMCFAVVVMGKGFVERKLAGAAAAQTGERLCSDRSSLGREPEVLEATASLSVMWTVPDLVWPLHCPWTARLAYSVPCSLL